MDAVNKLYNTMMSQGGQSASASADTSKENNSSNSNAVGKLYSSMMESAFISNYHDRMNQWNSLSSSEKSFLGAKARGEDSDSFLQKAQANRDAVKKDVDALQAQIDAIGKKSFISIRDRAEMNELNKRLEEANKKYADYDEELGFAESWHNDDIDTKWESDQYASGATDLTIKQGLSAGEANLNKQRAELVEQLKAASNGSQFAGDQPTYGESNQEVAIKALEEQIASIDRQLADISRRTQRVNKRIDESALAPRFTERGKAAVEAADLDFLNNFSVTGSPAEQSDFASWQLNNPNGTVEEYGRAKLADRRVNENWTPEQINHFYVLQGMGNQDEADRYAVGINSAINAAERAEKTAAFEQAGRGIDMSKEARDQRSFLENLGAGTANVFAGIGDIGMSVATAPTHLFNWLDRMYQNQQRDGYYAGSSTPYLTDYTDAAVSARAKALNEDYPNMKVDLPFIGKKGLGDFYQLGQSMAQSLAYGNLVGEGATLVMFFGQAADQTYQEAQQKGYSPEQAAAVSVLAGIAEVMGEKIGLDHLLNADAALVKSTMRFMLEQAGIEGLEEGFTDMFNLFGDQLAAKLTGGEADIQRQIRVLMQQNGMSYEEAARQVWTDQAKETAWSMVGGALSGLGSGMIQSGGNILAEHQQKRATERFKKNANDLLQNLKPEQIAGYSEYDLQRLKNLAENLGKTDAAETIQKVIDQKKAEAAAQNQAGEAEEGPSFGKRLVDEASEKEPELQGSLRVLFELDNETFERNLRWFDKNEKVLRDMYEWALWNEEFDKADIIKNMAKASGFDLNKAASDAAEEKAPPPGDEEAPPSDEDAPPAAEGEAESAKNDSLDTVDGAYGRVKRLIDSGVLEGNERLFADELSKQLRAYYNDYTAKGISDQAELNRILAEARRFVERNESRLEANQAGAAAGTEFVQRLLWEGRVNNTEAEQIARDPQLSAVFEDTTGFQLTGTLHDRIKLIQHVARGFRDTRGQAQDVVSIRNEQQREREAKATEEKRIANEQEAARKRAEEEKAKAAEAEAKAAEEKRQYDKEGYESYIRGLLADNPNGLTREQAAEIWDDENLRKAFGAVTETLVPPKNRKSGIKHILNNAALPGGKQIQHKFNGQEYEDVYEIAKNSDAKTVSDLADVLREAANANKNIYDQIMESGKNKLVDGRTKLGRALKILRAEFGESSTTGTESGTIEPESKPNNPLVNESKEANNGGKQAVREPEAGTAGVQSTPAAEGRREGAVAEPQAERPVESAENRGGSEASGQATEDVPRAERGSRKNEKSPRKAKPKWLTSEQDSSDFDKWQSEGKSTGKRAPAPMGKDVLDLKKDGGTGVIQTLPGTQIIEAPDVGTVAHMVFKILDAFNVKSHQRHVYSTKYFANFGSDGQLGVIKGVNNGGQVAVAVDETADMPIQQNAIKTAIHECTHRNFGKKFGTNGSRAKISSVDTSKAITVDSVTVEQRSEYTYNKLIECFVKAGFSESGARAGISEIAEFWLNEADENGNGGFGYATQYDVDGTQKQYADSASGLNLGPESLESVVRAALQKRVSEEMLVDLTCNSPKIAALVREGVISYEDSLKLKDAALNALAADGVLQQKEVDAINVAFEAMQNFDFVEASLSTTGSSDTNISQSPASQRSSYAPAVRFVEKDFNANRSKKAQPNPDEGKSPPKKVKTVEHDSVASAAKAISGIKTVFEGGAEGFPDVIAIDRNGRTYTIPENVKSAVKQVKNAVRGIGEGKHPMRSLGKLIQLYDNFATPGSDMARFTTDEINQAIADIKEIGNSKTLSDNQKIMRLETATTRALNLIGAQMRNVNEAFEMDFEIAKLIAGDGKSVVRNRLARGFLAKTASGVNEAYSVWKSLQLNPTTMFKMIGKFDKASGNAGYQIANKIERATAISQMNYAIAMQEFNELRNMKGFNEFATNKTKCSVKLGDIELTEQEAVDFIKRVNTLKATVIGGKSRLSTIKGFTIKGSDGKYVYIDSKAVKSKWADIASSMEKSLSPVAKAYMDAASKALYDLGGKVSEMKRNTTGVGFWTMEKGVYYPLQYHSPSHEDVSLDSEITNFFGPTGASVTLQRTRDEGGYVVIQPSALTVDNYINRASSYTGFGQLATQLGIMDAPGAGLNGLSNMVANNFGKQYGKVVRNYVNDMNNVMRAESGFNKLARKLRMNLQKGALMTSVSVPMKQVASYWNAIGVLSPEAVTKAYRFKMLKAKGSGAENMLLAYRAVGGIDPTVSEVLNNKDFLRGLKKKAKIIDTFDKAISIMDYRTVDNLYAATVLDVNATFPDVDVNSEEFARLVNAKFEEVVINTQPIYTALARSESQRTNNEIIRNLSTFRTQQTQNFNRLVTTLGEARAAKGTVGELLADKALKQTIGGQVAAQVEFGLLGVLADLVLHRLKKYRRDDDDKIDPWKIAERWFINTVESAAGTVWLGDQAAKWAIDRIAKAVNDDTDIHEFYGVSVGALSTIKQTYDSFGYFMDKPSVYNFKRLLVNLSTISGLPIGNLYNNANALIMWGASILGENPDKYDDVIKYVFGEETKKDKENRKADKLYQAVADGNTEKANKLFEYYGSKADANEQIAGAIMRRYQAGKLDKEAAVNELREYADMSKYDAEHYINEATAKLELGYEYSKIKDKYQSGEITRQEALSYRQKYGSESARDAEAEVQKWTMEVDTGYDYSDLEKHFAAGDVTKEDAIRYRVKYGGEDREDAEKTVAHWQCEVDTDIPYSEITDYYVSGEISKSKLVSYYQKYGLYDAEKAQEKADVAQFIWDKKDQLGDATAAAVRGYNNYCGDLGIDKEFYLSNYFAINKVEGVKNSKGKTISGSVVTNKIKYIDNLNLTPAQKTAIANACNIELKSLKKYHAPWL